MQTRNLSSQMTCNYPRQCEKRHFCVLWPSDPKIDGFSVLSMGQPCVKFCDPSFFHFELSCRQTDRHTHRQMHASKNLTDTWLPPARVTRKMCSSVNMQPHAGPSSFALYNPSNLTFDLLTSGSNHAEALPSTICVLTLVLITAAVFLLQHSHRHMHTRTPTPRLMPVWVMKMYWDVVVIKQDCVGLIWHSNAEQHIKHTMQLPLSIGEGHIRGWELSKMNWGTSTDGRCLKGSVLGK